MLFFVYLAVPPTKEAEVVDQGRSPEDNEGSRDGSGDSSAMKRKYSDREPESPGQVEPTAAFGPSDPKKERNYYETLDTDSPSSYPKHVIVPSEKPMDDQYTNVTNTPEDQRAAQPPPDHGAQVLTPDSMDRSRPAGGSYDSHQYRQPYHDVYRTPSYNPDMDYGRGSYGGSATGAGAAPPGGEFTRQRRWACDICNVATFLSYEEACAHEEMCSRRFEGQQFHDPRQAPPPHFSGPRGSAPPQGSGLGALYHASQEVVTPPTPHRHPQPRWSGSHGPHGPPLPVFPHEQHYYRQGPYDGRDDPHHYDPHGYPPHHPSGPSQPPPYYPSQHLPPHGAQDYYQKRMLLAMPSDRDSLSDRQCYVRSEMVEIFAATDKDVAARHSKGAQKLEMGQVGIRCVHCSHLRPRDRAERAVCYPSSISRIYQTVADMQRFHFEQCREIPDHVRQVYKKLKTTRPRGVGSPQAYWMTSAKSLGLADTESGIRFEADGPSASGTKQESQQISDMSIGTN